MDSFTTNNPSSFYDSSSSDFSSPFGSELDSSESDDGDYMAELTRQMAECMLQEEDHQQEQIIATTSNSVKLPKIINTALNNGLHPTRKVIVDDPRITHHQIYNLKNGEPPFIKKQISEQPLKQISNNPNNNKNKNYMHYNMRSTTTTRWGNNNGSGLQAVFLGQPGSKNASTGTGVFLPRVTTQSTTSSKKKPGCSTVLIPTRVLQTLELHFNRRLDSGALKYPSNFKDESLIQRRNGESQSENRGTRHEEVDEEEMQLPKEWTY